MSDANEAREKFIESNQGNEFPGEPNAFVAGFAAGQVAVIDMLRHFLPEWNYPDYVIAAICLEIKARAAELSKEQHDQPDAQIP